MGKGIHTDVNPPAPQGQHWNHPRPISKEGQHTAGNQFWLYLANPQENKLIHHHCIGNTWIGIGEGQKRTQKERDRERERDPKWETQRTYRCDRQRAWGADRERVAREMERGERREEIKSEWGWRERRGRESGRVRASLIHFILADGPRPVQKLPDS